MVLKVPSDPGHSMFLFLLVVMQTSDSVMNYTVCFLEQPTILMGAFSNHTKLILRDYQVFIGGINYDLD